jgi:DNA-directed RNA polymerase specialized sigma24 family protein
MTGTQALIGRVPNNRTSTHSRAVGMAGLSTDAEPVGLDDRTMEFIRWKALRLGGSGVFTGYDAQDLKQDMLLECWRASSRFDHTRSCRRTFFQRVINNLIASMMEAQRAACRDSRCLRSLNEPVAFAGNGPREFGDSIPDDNDGARVGRSSLCAYERSELLIDVARVIAILPRELAAIASLLQSVGIVETAHFNNGLGGPCLQLNNVPDTCILAESLDTFPGSNVFHNLTVSAPFNSSDPNYLKLILNGTFTVQNAAQIDTVATRVGACAPTVASASCTNGPFNGYNKLGSTNFTGTTVSPSIPVSVGQNVQVTVVLSFS